MRSNKRNLRPRLTVDSQLSQDEEDNTPEEDSNIRGRRHNYDDLSEDQVNRKANEDTLEFPYHLPARQNMGQIFVPLLPNDNTNASRPTNINTIQNDNSQIRNRNLSNQYSTICAQQSSDHWFTPPFIIRAIVNMISGPIDLDPASEPSAQRIVSAREYWSRNALNRLWTGNAVFLNPPFSQVGDFFTYALEQHKKGNAKELFVIARFAPSSAWFPRACSEEDVLWLAFNRRLTFWTAVDAGSKNMRVVPGRNQMPHEISFFYFGPNVTEFHQSFGSFGRINESQQAQVSKLLPKELKIEQDYIINQDNGYKEKENVNQ